MRIKYASLISETRRMDFYNPRVRAQLFPRVSFALSSLQRAAPAVFFSNFSRTPLVDFYYVCHATVLKESALPT